MSTKTPADPDDSDSISETECRSSSCLADIEADSSTMKRAAEDLIKKYFHQLTDGCGDSTCDNVHCASCPQGKQCNKDEAAGLALKLMFKKAKLCSIKDVLTVLPSKSTFTGLNKAQVSQLIETGQSSGHFNELVHSVGRVFSSSELLNRSFVSPGLEHVSSKVTVCVEDAEEALGALSQLEEDSVENAMIMAISNLGSFLEIDLKMSTAPRATDFLNQFVIVLLHPGLQSPAYLDSAVPNILRAMTCLDIESQTALTLFWSTLGADRLKLIVSNLLQLITYQILVGPYETTGKAVNDDVSITSAVKCMKMVYYASLLGSRRSKAATVAAEMPKSDDEAASRSGESIPKDPLLEKLELNVAEFREPLLDYEVFHNEILFEKIEMDRDYTNYKIGDSRFSFLNYPFALDTATKSLGLFYDNRVRMYSERRMTLLVSLMRGQMPSPYLRLRVRRDHLIEDSLVRLEMTAQDNPADLKKQLFVEFEGEQGIDEGGVSKEFFQLVIEEIFNPDYGMFVYDEDNRLFWFNPTSFEADGQYTLIGLVFGLAIYNSIILDVRFPDVLYRKLCGIQGTPEDLKTAYPIIYHSLQELLAYDGDVEADIMQTFQIAYHDVFGSKLTYELREGGSDIAVTADNRQEFVDLYADFLLNKSVEKQFHAFKRGYDMVTSDSIMKSLFRPDELELLICGSKVFDFDNLEKTTEYDGGYTSESKVIKNFWDVVRSLALEEKRQLLMFTTGSDRVPVGGLAKLKLIIAKNGPDSDRLPTAHTCFNVLLLPDYSSREKLENRLLKAITHAKGFGLM